MFTFSGHRFCVCPVKCKKAAALGTKGGALTAHVLLPHTHALNISKAFSLLCSNQNQTKMEWLVEEFM